MKFHIPPFSVMLSCNFANRITGVFAAGLLFCLLSCQTMAQQNTNTYYINTYNTWKCLLSEPSKPTEIIQFIQNHPDWPRKTNLIEILERSLNGTEDQSMLLQWFEKNPPLTVEGAILYIKILLKIGKTEEAQALIKTTWREKDFSKSLSSEFRKTYATIIQAEDDQARVNRLLYKEDISASQDMLAWLDQSQQDLVKTQLELIQEKPTASQKLSNTLTFIKNNKTLAFNQIKWNRRQRNDQAAIDLIMSFSPENNQEETRFPDEWWTERNILGRRMIEAKRFSEALKVMQGHKLTRGENFANAEWLIGWLQLRFLNQPNEALQRFQNLYNSVGSPISKARAAFWTAEAAKAVGQTEEAREWYKWASVHPATYYGQLAISRLNVMGIQLAQFKFLRSPSASLEVKKKFEDRELVKVIKLLPNGEREEFVTPLFIKLADSIDDPTEQELLVELAHKVGSSYAAVQTAKKVSRTQIPMTPVAYPLLSANLRNTIKKMGDKGEFLACFTHAIIRQESRFDPNALSSAGAQGLMQLMPATANQEIKKLKRVKISHKAPLYNVEKNVYLGVSHVKNLLTEFQGSLVLTIAAYNAGKKAVLEWIGLFGNPITDPNIDIVDWIELIPYAETRNYVQRVMENFIVYQERFKNSLRSDYDLSQHLKVCLH
jgi:soluble lytic murein transglycosylase